MSNNNTGYQLLVGKDKESQRDFVFGIGGATNSKLFFSMFSSTGVPAESSQTIATGVIYHGVAVAKSGTYNLWINGKLDGTGTFSGPPQVYGSVSIGRRDYTGYPQYWNGRIDDVRFYNRALTETEIRLLASERGIGLKPERLRNRYKKSSSYRRRQYLQPVGVGLV
jgi:hypothetical protein